MSSYISVELNEQGELVTKCVGCSEDQKSLLDDVIIFAKGILGLEE